MRKYIYTLLITIAFWGLNAQTCDISITGLKPITSTLETGESTDLVFSVQNTGHGSLCSYETNSIHVYLFLPVNGLVFDEVVYPLDGKGKYFKWTYDASAHTMIGVNHLPIQNLEGEENITIRVKATSINSISAERTIGLSVLQNPDGKIFPSNNAANDNATITIRLKTPEFFKDLAFDVENTECGLMKIRLESKSIVNESTELQRSQDGVTFISLTKLLSSQNVSDVYTYIDNNQLESGQSYYYRLRHVEVNGVEQVYTLGVFENNCKSVIPTLTVFPNPTLDKVNVSIKDLNDPSNVDLIISNSSGERVMVIPSVNLNHTVEVKLQGLSAGIYNIETSNVHVKGSRFIKIN